MASIAFYHLQKTPLEQVLPKLLEKTLEAGKRAVVLAGTADRVEALNMLLWAVNPNGWLPHGSAKDGSPADQPVWLTNQEENPNGATFLFMTDGVMATSLDGYDRCFDLFDGNDDGAVTAARGRWKEFKEAGHDLTYWQQPDQGRWEEKA
jgi:DNA polymerase-3 subunit chi